MNVKKLVVQNIQGTAFVAGFLFRAGIGLVTLDHLLLTYGRVPILPYLFAFSMVVWVMHPAIRVIVNQLTRMWGLDNEV